MAKTIEGGVAFATQIVQEKYEQGFKIFVCVQMI